MPEREVVLVVAAAENGVIGRAGQLPWRMPSDMRLFRRLTLGKPVIMGRRTYQSLKSLLKDRDNIIVTRDHALSVTGAYVAHTVEAALAIAERCAEARQASEIAVIGGSEIFAQALPFASAIYLTRIHASLDGDTTFPELPAAEWTVEGNEPLSPDPSDDYRATFITLRRNTPAKPHVGN